MKEIIKKDPQIIEKIRWRRITKEYLSSRNSAVFCEGSNLHPAFKLYKYYWWIFPKNSEFESAGEVFYNDKYKLTTKEAHELMEELSNQNIPFAYVNRKRKRLGCDIWDYEKLKQEFPNIEFAPAYEDDEDEEWEGHK